MLHEQQGMRRCIQDRQYARQSKQGRAHFFRQVGRKNGAEHLERFRLVVVAKSHVFFRSVWLRVDNVQGCERKHTVHQATKDRSTSVTCSGEGGMLHTAQPDVSHNDSTESSSDAH